MVNRDDLNRVSDGIYEIPKTARADMRVPARLYADEALLELALGDRSVEQLLNTATLPGVVRHVLAMPDVHQGYGFPIGGVAATALPDGAISPGGVGYDINCGVRLLASGLEAAAVRPFIQPLMSALFGDVATGAGAGGGAINLSKQEMHDVLHQGSRWLVGRGYARPEDVAHTEDSGCMASADMAALTPRALERGQEQLGSLGSGNHFLEVDEVTEVFDAEAAEVLGLKQGAACVWIHCGSRGLGHQVCTDAVRAMQSAVQKFKITLPDRELVCAPFQSEEGQRYFKGMSCAANYAWANRQMITHLVRQVWERVLGSLGSTDLRLVYDVCHNIAKVEEHVVGGRRIKVCVHRKGATRAFGPGYAEVPADYRALGQPVLIPGNMQSGSFVLLGTEQAMLDTFGSTAHGAGRTMSRAEARRNVRGEDLHAILAQQQITVRAGSMAGLAEEAPVAYKDVDAVVGVVHRTGLARLVARCRPLGVIKG